MRTYEIHVETREEQLTAVSDATIAVTEIGPWLARACGAVEGVLAGQGAFPVGPPFARYHRLAEDKFVVEAGFPVHAPITPAADVRPARLPGGAVAVTIHVGPYEKMASAYDALAEWIAGQDGTPIGDAWEIYLDGPEVGQPRTKIIQPFRPRTMSHR